MNAFFLIVFNVRITTAYFVLSMIRNTSNNHTDSDQTKRAHSPVVSIILSSEKL